VIRPPRRLAHGQGADLVEHLGELRARLVVCLVALAAGTGVAYTFRGRILGFLNGPLPGHRQPITFGVAEPFTTSLKISIVAGLALALPIVLWQVWSFLAPAFEPRIQRTIAGSVVIATALFAVGVVFAARVALPAAVKFLTSYDDHLYNIQIRARDFISFATVVLLAVTVVFELPVFILALVRIGLLSSAKLRRNRRIGYAAMAVLAVALPGVDPVTTTIEMIPLFLLYEMSIWLSVLLDQRTSAREADTASA
jgi:sec-independent protein translocase protein TatC